MDLVRPFSGECFAFQIEPEAMRGRKHIGVAAS
jgi:hypothetical protein